MGRHPWIAYVSAFVVAIALLIGGWFLVWYLRGQAASNQYQVNTHSQQYQATVIAQERSLVTAIETASTAGQRTAFTERSSSMVPRPSSRRPASRPWTQVRGWPPCQPRTSSSRE